MCRFIQPIHFPKTKKPVYQALKISAKFDQEFSVRLHSAEFPHDTFSHFLVGFDCTAASPGQGINTTTGIVRVNIVTSSQR